MEKIKIMVADKIATAEENAVIICGNSDYMIDFAFDDEWSAYPTKTARFVYLIDGIIKYIDVPFDGNECQVPVLSNVKWVKVGVFAGNLCTTTGATIKCKKSILCDGGTHTEPDDNTYNIIMDMLNSLMNGTGGGTFIIDSQMSTTSTNAVQNKVVYDFVNDMAEQAVQLIDEKDYEIRKDLGNYLDEIVKIFVVKEQGKGLSTNDFTNDYKTKLDNLEEYVDSVIGGIENGSY